MIRPSTLVLVLVAVILLVTAVAAEAAPSVYAVDRAQDRAVAGAIENHRWCLRYATGPRKTACHETGTALKRRARAAMRAIAAADPVPNGPCTRRAFIPSQMSAHRAAIAAGAGRSLALISAWRNAEARAENAERVCTRKGFR